MQLTLTIVRPVDLLVLSVQAVNLRLDTSQPSRPRLVRDTPGGAAYLVYVFPPQSIAEQAFFETALVAQPGYNPPPSTPPLPGPPGLPSGPDTLLPPGSVASLTACESQLVFRLPSSLAEVEYSIAGLLTGRSWSPWFRRGRCPARIVQRGVGAAADRAPGQPGNLPGTAVPADDVAERHAGRGAARLGARGRRRCCTRDAPSCGIRGSASCGARAARSISPRRARPRRSRCAPSGRRTSWPTARCRRRTRPSGPPWWRATATRSSSSPPGSAATRSPGPPGPSRTCRCRWTPAGCSCPRWAAG